MNIRNHPNVGISTTSRVEGSHWAINRGLTSSSGTLHTAGKKTEPVQRGSEPDRDIEPVTAISRSGLELIYSEVMKKVQQQEQGSWESCTRSSWNRYLLSCSHRIQLGVPIAAKDIHPRWWVNPEFPPVNGSLLQMSAEVVPKTTDRIKKVRRCGSCKMTRHNSRKCPKLSSNLML
ncbi:hypothetical protein V1517DRAFT_350147 [Lipomyces orientalis]|uniref:Uncharacterized protein n=1 Tax=Lipomyces orientalis TaxID=1233043 RepID=A0ACC3TY15_9ASCO